MKRRSVRRTARRQIKRQTVRRRVKHRRTARPKRRFGRRSKRKTHTMNTRRSTNRRAHRARRRTRRRMQTGGADEKADVFRQWVEEEVIGKPGKLTLANFESHISRIHNESERANGKTEQVIQMEISLLKYIEGLYFRNDNGSELTNNVDDIYDPPKAAYELILQSKSSAQFGGEGSTTKKKLVALAGVGLPLIAWLSNQGHVVGDMGKMGTGVAARIIDDTENINNVLNEVYVANSFNTDTSGVADILGIGDADGNDGTTNSMNDWSNSLNNWGNDIKSSVGDHVNVAKDFASNVYDNPVLSTASALATPIKFGAAFSVKNVQGSPNQIDIVSPVEGQPTIRLDVSDTSVGMVNSQNKYVRKYLSFIRGEEVVADGMDAFDDYMQNDVPEAIRKHTETVAGVTGGTIDAVSGGLNKLRDFSKRVVSGATNGVAEGLNRVGIKGPIETIEKASARKAELVKLNAFLESVDAEAAGYLQSALTQTANGNMETATMYMEIAIGKMIIDVKISIAKMNIVVDSIAQIKALTTEDAAQLARILNELIPKNLTELQAAALRATLVNLFTVGLATE